MIARREDYHYVTGDILAKDAHDPQKYTVMIDGTSMGGAEQGSVRRLIPRGEDICWLYEAFTARDAFLGGSLDIATLSFDSDGGTLDGATSVTPYEFLRCYPQPWPQPVDARANLSEPGKIVDVYNRCLYGHRFINPFSPSPFDPSQAIVRYSTDRSGIPKEFLWDKRYDPQNGYSLEKLSSSYRYLPKVVGERLASVESRMGWFKYGLRNTSYAYNGDYSALEFDGSATGHGEHPPTPPDIEAYRDAGYISIYICRGWYTGDEGADYYVVKGDAPDRLKLMAGKVHDWITSVRPVYLLEYRYYHHHHNSGSADDPDNIDNYYSGRGVVSPARTYQIDSDGYVTLQVRSDIQDWKPASEYGGDVDSLVPESPSLQYIHEWRIKLAGVELIATFDDAICKC